ncbi:unnamed protein product [Callosobruchus maculatus]|uniref:Uncharacterized protein n=1 Tax=Callosobruchus maculatus TaxID=64391 RepID=A0A653BM57_CALMS|nr:unnamed protein product [Callosobruchus maculatus]
MARFISTRLNVNILNQIKSFSSKFIPHELRNRVEDDHTDSLLNAEYSGSSIRYKVCRDSQASKQKFVFESKPVIVLNRENAGVKSSQEAENNVVPTSGEKGYRSFDISTTQKNCVLPLKTSTLSSPFPAPVKDFLSDALSLSLQKY